MLVINPQPLFKVFTHPQHIKNHILARKLLQTQQSAPLAIFKNIMSSPSASYKKSKEYYEEKQIELSMHLEKNVHQCMEYHKAKTQGMMNLVCYKKEFFNDVSVQEFRNKIDNCHELVPKGFKRMSSGVYDYEMDGTLSPSESLETFLEGPVVVDNGSCMEALFLKTIKDCISDERFNAIFSQRDFHLKLINASGLHADSVLQAFTKLLPKISKGARCYFSGVPFHELKHASIDKMGCVAIILDSQENNIASWCLGWDRPITLQEIEMLVLDDYNKFCPYHSDYSAARSIDPKKLRLIEYKLNPSMHHLVNFNINLGFPDLTLREARQLGAGVQGEKIVDAISVELVDLVNCCSIQAIRDERFPTYLYYESLKMQYVNFSQNIFSFFKQEPLEDLHLWRY